MNSAAIADPDLIDAIGRSFGAQAVVVAIDARRDRSDDPVREAEVFVRADASRLAAAWWSGRAKRKSAARARFC